VLAPGDGEAEPGVTNTNFREPAKLATDVLFQVSSFAHFVGSEAFGVWFPRLGFAIAWG
jgi:hypothetical protein